MEENQIIQHATHPDMVDIHPDSIPVKYLMTASANTREYSVPATNTIPAAGFTSGKLSFNNIRLNPGEALDRTILLEVDIKVKVQGAANGTAANSSDFAKLNGLCLAAYPLNRAMTDLNVRLNGNGKSIAPWELVGAFNHTHDSIEYRRLNTFPSQPDNYNTRVAMAITGGLRVDGAYASSNAILAAGANALTGFELESSPDSPYGNFSSSYDTPRCKFPPIAVTYTPSSNGGRVEAEFTFRVTEPLLHPFFRTNEFKSVLSRVSNLDVDCLFGSINTCFVNSRELIKNWVDVTATTTLGQATILGGADIPRITAANLLYRVYVPTVQVPMVLSIPYMEPVVYREPVPDFAANARTQTVNTRTYQIAQVPHKIMLYARPRGQFADDLSPEAFLTINKIQFRTAGDSGGLANASNAQLFQISQRNGLNMPYNKFARDIGSIVVLDLEKGDIGGFVPGTRESFNFDITVSFTNNLHTRPVAGGRIFQDDAATAPVVTVFDFYIVCFMDSKMILDGTTCTLVNGENQELVKQVLAERPVSFVGDQMTGRGVMVGGSWKGFVKFINGAARGIGDVLGMGKNVMGVVNQGRALLGRGVGDPQAYPGSYGSGLRVLG